MRYDIKMSKIICLIILFNESLCLTASTASLPMRLIYNKDKFLDKSQYKPTEEEYKHVYYKNYVEADNLPEDQKQKVMEEAKKYEDMQKATRQSDEEKKFVDLDQIKNMFDTITGKYIQGL